VVGCCEHGNEPSGYMKGRVCLDYDQLLKRLCSMELATGLVVCVGLVGSQRWRLATSVGSLLFKVRNGQDNCVQWPPIDHDKETPLSISKPQ
jgi:hypothetical protein